MALLGLSLAVLLGSLGTSSANLALPTLARAFGASFQAIQWVVIAYLLALTAASVAAGRLGDVFGARWLLLAGLAVFALASVACGIAPGLAWLVAARSVQGLAAAVMLALAVAFVAEVAPSGKTGSAMGLLGSASAVGTALGPALGGALIGSFGWRAVFLANVPLALVGLALLAHGLPPERLARRAGVGAKTPLFRRSLLADRVLGASLGASLLVSAVVMTTLVVGPFYLSLGLGLAPPAVGLVMSVGPLVAAVTGVPAGRVVDRLGTRRTTLFGLGGLALGAFLLSLLPEALGVPAYVAPMVVMTASYALFQAANNTGVMQRVRLDERGVVAGTLNLSRNLGLVAGSWVLGAVFAAASGATEITLARPAAIATATRLTYAAATALGLVALVWIARAAEARLEQRKASPVP